MKKLLMVLAVAAVVVLLVSFAKDTIVKTSVERGVEMVTGLKMTIRSIHVGILKAVVDIKDIRVDNPSGFSDRTMIDMPVVYVQYDLPAMMGGKIHLPEARLALKEFVVVKNQKGELNLNALRSVQARKGGKQAVPGKAPEMMIDRLVLSIGKVVYKDYSRPGVPLVKEFNINLNETYTNVDSPYTLANLIVVKALMNTSIASLANFDLKGLQGTVGDALASAQKISAAVANVNDTIAATQAQAAGTVKTATAAAKQAQDAAKQAADSVKDIFKNPFDSK